MKPIDMARREAVYETVRRLPNAIAVYSKHGAAVLALLLAEDAALGPALAEDVWQSIRSNFPKMDPVVFAEKRDPWP